MGSNVANDFKRLANPGDPASLAQTKLFVLGYAGGKVPPGCGGPTLSACCFFPQRGSCYKEKLEISLHTSRDMAALQRPQGKD